MKLVDILSSVEKVIPLDLQEEWDQSGLQIGDLQMEIKGILFTLDITMEAIEYAIEKGINLIISHHPLFFQEVNSIINGIGKSDIIISLIQNNIAAYSMHTNLDKIENGVSHNLIKKLNLGESRILDEDGFVRAVNYIEKFSVLLDAIKDAFDINTLIYYGNEEDLIQKIAVCGGSGGSFIPLCLNNNVDLYITGDLKHHDVEEALLHGMNLVDLGHYTSEVHILDVLEKIFRNIFKDLEIIVFKKNLYERKYR